MIITDEEALRIKCEPVLPDEVDDLRSKLEEALAWSARQGRVGVGLACPQIGIGKTMAIIRIDDSLKIDLVNAKITKMYHQFEFDGEGCLSFPDRWEKTLRFQEIVVEENLVEPHRFIVTDFAAVAVQHECLPASALVETDLGLIKIKDIVNDKIKCNVLSMSENNEFVYKPIVGYSKLANKNKKKWVRVKFSKTGPNKQLKCTDDHLCAYIDNILNYSEIKYTEAKNLVGKYIVRKPDCLLKNKEQPLYGKNQMSSIIGGLLGDLCIDERGSIRISHGEPQREYAEYKAKILGGYVKRGFSGYRKENSNYNVEAPLTEQTKLLRKICYGSGKEIAQIIDFVDDIALAFWYMDDGCLVNGKYAQFHTEGFSKSEIKKLMDMLSVRFGIESCIQSRNVKSKQRYFLFLNSSGSRKLFETIGKYIIDSMRYKIPKGYEDFQDVFFERLNYSAKLVTSVSEVFCESYLYNIEVEENHNFVADKTLVHNCDHLKGVLLPDVALGK